jgi:hypothetical protein
MAHRRRRYGETASHWLWAEFVFFKNILLKIENCEIFFFIRKQTSVNNQTNHAESGAETLPGSNGWQ